MNNAPVPFQAFTMYSNDRIRSIVSDVSLSPPIPFTENFVDIKSIPNVVSTKALWDTGATNCVITEKTAKELGINPISIAEVHHAGGTSITPVYLVNIYLPNHVLLKGVRVTECKDTEGGFGAIIGMDIITLGDFAITNVSGKSVFTFRIPSCQTIDYYKESNKIQALKFKDVGRNQLCPCGSGKKFKDCHQKFYNENR